MAHRSIAHSADFDDKRRRQPTPELIERQGRLRRLVGGILAMAVLILLVAGIRSVRSRAQGTAEAPVPAAVPQVAAIVPLPAPAETAGAATEASPAAVAPAPEPKPAANFGRQTGRPPRSGPAARQGQGPSRREVTGRVRGAPGDVERRDLDPGGALG